MAIKDKNRTRSLVWEDEAPAEARFRRVQASAPHVGRTLPGMPLEADDPAGDDAPRFRDSVADGSKRPWWRPAGVWGRTFLAIGVFVAVAAVSLGVYELRTFLERDARFRIMGSENIDATGLAEVTRAEMLPVFGEDIGRNIFFVPLSERRKQLEQIPWVERATVMRLLPDQLRISVVERQPIAFTRSGAQIGLVDANGVLLTMPAAMMAQRHYSFPVLTGIDGRDPLASRRARMGLYQRLVAELDSGGQKFSDQISEIDLTDPENARILMPGQGTDITADFGEDHFLERYQRYREHIAEWRQQHPDLSEVDLRYDQQVVLKMSSAPAPANTPAVETAAAAKPAAGQPAKPETVAAHKTESAHKTEPAHAAPARKAAKSAAEKRKQAKRAEAHRTAVNRQKAAKNHASAAQGQ